MAQAEPNDETRLKILKSMENIEQKAKTSGTEVTRDLASIRGQLRTANVSIEAIQRQMSVVQNKVDGMSRLEAVVSAYSNEIPTKVRGDVAALVQQGVDDIRAYSNNMNPSVATEIAKAVRMWNAADADACAHVPVQSHFHGYTRIIPPGFVESARGRARRGRTTIPWKKTTSLEVKPEQCSLTMFSESPAKQYVGSTYDLAQPSHYAVVAVSNAINEDRALTRDPAEEGLLQRAVFGLIGGSASSHTLKEVREFMHAVFVLAAKLTLMRRMEGAPAEEAEQTRAFKAILDALHREQPGSGMLVLADIHQVLIDIPATRYVP